MIFQNDKAVAPREKKAVQFAKRGWALLNAGRHQEALAACNSAIARDPELSFAHVIRGRVLDGLHQREEALAAYDRGIALEPDSALAHFYRADLLLLLLCYDEALEACGRGLALGTLNSDFYSDALALREFIVVGKRTLERYGLSGRLLRHTPIRKAENDVVGESKKPGYTDAAPSSEAAVTPPLRMRDDLNIAVRQAKAEAVAPLAGALAVARYEVLARHVDLLNPRLAEDERLSRAERLLKAYNRVRKANPDFRDTSEELRAARRIRMADYRQRKRAKLQAHEAA